MANSMIITRAGKGSALSAGDNDVNLKSLAGTSQSITDDAYTVTSADQNQMLEFTSSGVTVTLTSITTILADVGTDSFKVYLRNLNATALTVNRGSTNTIDGATSLSIAQYETVCLQTSTASGVWAIQSWRQKAANFLTAKLTTGATVNEFSTDGTLAGNSDSAVPTEKAVKTYTDAADSASAATLTTAFQAYTDAVPRIVDVGTISLGTTQSIAVTGDPDRLEVSIYAAAQSTGVDIFLRIGTGASLHVAGYRAAAGDDGGSNVATAGFPLKSSSGTVGTISGNLTLQRIKAIGGGLDAWNVSGVVYMDTAVTDSATFISGRITFSGALDIIGIGVASGSVTGGFMRVWAQVTG